MFHVMKKDALPLSSQLEHVLGEIVRFLSERASTLFMCQPPVAPVCRNAFASSCEGNRIGFVLFHTMVSSSPCTGYLGHPFKNEHLEAEKSSTPACHTGGLVYNQTSSKACSCSIDNTLT